jgi:DNA primase
LSGTSDTALPFFLNQHKAVRELVFCLDNDPAGREAAVTLSCKYAEKGLFTRLELPKNKDFNEDLLVYKGETSPEHVPKQYTERMSI